MSSGHFVRSYEVWRLGEEGFDDFGQPLPAEWAKVADVLGRAYPGTRSETRSQYFAATGKVAWTFACASDADLQRNDEIRFDGLAIRVIAKATTSRGARVESLCEEYQPS